MHYKTTSTDSATQTPMPAVTHVCRVCGCAMQAIHRAEGKQTNSQGVTRIIPASTIVTCKNPDCQLVDFTFEASTYASENLRVYGVKAVAR